VCRRRPPAGGQRELGDERRGHGEYSVEAILDRAIGDRHRQVGLARAAGPAEDQRVAAGDELRAEDAAEQREPDGGLEGEVVLVDGLENR